MQQNIDGVLPATADHTNKLKVAGTFAPVALAASSLRVAT